ncbi:unnamed protein product [Gongylonema pulchrum]|uniref:Secreted protein n=1 Tax=Gongylonema pulchrum TaxID=637853 RepID=A0A183DXA7_9BILA|nr:unnamed protein product [Gongylonema pulchrum]
MVIQWSWNCARLIALVLNALVGLEQYYNAHHTELDVDGVFGLRIIQGHLTGIEQLLHDEDVHSEIVNEIRNISRSAVALANKALSFVAVRDSEYFTQFRYLLQRPFVVNFSHRRTDERLRWKEKQLKANIFDDTMPAALLTENRSPSFLSHFVYTIFFNFFTLQNICFAELVLIGKEGNFSCKLSNECMQRMLSRPGFTGHHLIQQILYVAVAQQTPCISILTHFLLAEHNQTVANFLSEYCTNLIDELNAFMRNPKIVARLSSNGRDLLMEQIIAS